MVRTRNLKTSKSKHRNPVTNTQITSDTNTLDHKGSTTSSRKDFRTNSSITSYNFLEGSKEMKIKLFQEKGLKKYGRWNTEEKEKFETTLREFGEDWGKIQEAVPTRTYNQIRSHAQKYYQNLIIQKIRKLKQENKLEKKIFLITKFARNINRMKKVCKYELVYDIIVTNVPIINGAQPQNHQDIDKINESPYKILSDILLNIPDTILPIDKNTVFDFDLDFQDNSAITPHGDPKGNDEVQEDEYRVCEKGRFSYIFDD